VSSTPDLPEVPAVWQRAWETSTLRQRVTAGLGGVPDLLDVTLPTDVGVNAAPAHWHCALYGDLVLRKTGTTFSPKDCYRVLRAHGITWNTDTVVDALVGFLDTLRIAGDLSFERTTTGRPAGDIRVIADVTRRPSPPARPEPTATAPTKPAADPGDRLAALAAATAELPSPAPAPDAAATAPAATVRAPRTQAEAAWLTDTTTALKGQGISDAGVDALLSVARWGVAVAVEARAPRS